MYRISSLAMLLHIRAQWSCPALPFPTDRRRHTSGALVHCHKSRQGQTWCGISAIDVDAFLPVAVTKRLEQPVVVIAEHCIFLCPDLQAVRQNERLHIGLFLYLRGISSRVTSDDLLRYFMICCVAILLLLFQTLSPPDMRILFYEPSSSPSGYTPYTFESTTASSRDLSKKFWLTIMKKRREPVWFQRSVHFLWYIRTYFRPKGKNER